MVQENAEIVRRLYDAVANRDVETVLSLYDQDVEWDFTRHPLATVTGGIYRGHEGLRSFFGELREAWDIVEWGLEDVIEAGNQVVTVVNQRVRGRRSGAEAEGQAYAVAVWTIEKGKVVRVVWF